MITLYGLKACDTCRKALRALQEAGQDVQLHDIRAVPVTRQALEKWSEAFGPALLNTRSTTWRGLDEGERAGDTIQLMLDHPALVKRPVIETPDRLLLGWSKETQAALGL